MSNAQMLLEIKRRQKAREGSIADQLEILFALRRNRRRSQWQCPFDHSLETELAQMLRLRVYAFGAYYFGRRLRWKYKRSAWARFVRKF